MWFVTPTPSPLPPEPCAPFRAFIWCHAKPIRDQPSLRGEVLHMDDRQQAVGVRDLVRFSPTTWPNYPEHLEDLGNVVEAGSKAKHYNQASSGGQCCEKSLAATRDNSVSERRCHKPIKH